MDCVITEGGSLCALWRSNDNDIFLIGKSFEMGAWKSLSHGSFNDAKTPVHSCLEFLEEMFLRYARAASK